MATISKKSDKTIKTTIKKDPIKKDIKKESIKKESSKKESSKKESSKKESSKKDADTPRPGANAFHHFNYEQKTLLGDEYEYQTVIDNWHQMNEEEQIEYKSTAADAPRHKKKPGALRNVSAYDVLRNEISKHDFKLKVDKNKVQLASAIKKWIETNHSSAWGDNGQKWLITPTDDHIRLIKRGLKDLEWI